jgi:hypothetical protein
MSVFVDLAEAYKDRLLAAPEIVGDRVFRARQAALKKGWDNGIAVRLVRTQASLAGVGMGAPKDWETVIGIECAARLSLLEMAAGAVAEDAVDTVLAAAYARLAGWEPPGLSVLDALAEPGITWDTEEGEDQACRATFFVRVTHRTNASALTAWG